MTQPLGPVDPVPGTGMEYGGDVSVKEAWEALRDRSDARLVDVRTAAEWNYVGLPDLSECGKETILVEWQSFPEMSLNSDFINAVGRAIPDRDAPVYFLCRSGARSRAAAIALTSAGYRHCFNVSGGFEGPPDSDKHRGQVDGWKAHGLPWVQG